MVWIKWVADLIIRRSISSHPRGNEKCSSGDLVKVLLQHSHSHLLMSCLLDFLLQQQRWATAGGTKWHPEPKQLLDAILQKYLLTPAPKGQRPRTQRWSTMQASRGKAGKHREILRGAEDQEQKERKIGQEAVLTRLRKQCVPAPETTSRNTQT